MTDNIRGPIAFMIRNGVAANLLMVFILAAGIVAMGSLVQEVFPEFSLDRIQVSVPYPGASPDEVEESIVRKIEEQVEGVDGVKKITSTASEGMGMVVVELKLGADLSQALDDIKAEVDRIQTFPVGAERPEVRELTNRQSVIRLALYGDVSERTIKELAYRTEEELSALSDVSYVETSGIRDYEISIEVPIDRLRALGLTLEDIANAVRSGSLELSAGSIDTEDEQVRVRTLGQNYNQQEFEEIIVLARPNGTVIRLGDIATVHDGFEDADLVTRYKGQRAAFVEVYRTSDERVLDVAGAVEEHLEAVVIPNLPVGIELEIWNNDAEIFKDRMMLLQKNALIGLALVIIALTLFLEVRLALWVGVGIGISFIGTFAVMQVLGVSLNMLSLFAFILAVGIVVDDAIVVGENIYAERERGADGLTAAVRGTHRIRGPVIFAVLTTVAAFSPLFFVPGTMGKMMAAIPAIVISVLLISLLESLCILPHHLAHLSESHAAPTNAVTRFLSNTHKKVDAGLKRFTNGPLDTGLKFATGQPSTVIASGVALIILAIAMVPAGIVKVAFFPAIEGDLVIANLEMPEGTPGARTAEITEELEAAGYRALERLEEGRPDDAPPLFQAVNVTVGTGAAATSPLGQGGGEQLRGNIAAVEFKLLEAEQRDVSASTFQQAWRDEVGLMPEARALTFTANLVSFGLPVHAELSHPDPELLIEIGNAVADRLSEFQGVFDIQTDQDAGLREIQLELTAEARTLGLTLDQLARQVRSAFFGVEALRVQRGREDLRVYVRLPEDERNAIADVEGYLIRTPTGAEVPLGRAASVSYGNSPTTIRRTDGQRVLTVTADVDPEVVSGQQVSSQLENEILPALAGQYLGLTYTFGGEQQEQQESFGALFQGFLLALVVVYALLAIPFGSYTQPLIVMAAIPFGIIGAILGHLLLGLSVGIMSMFGIIGLSGVVVNDSLVMIDFINELERNGTPARKAIMEGAKARFRPIMLTSLTTFLGVAPLVFERSLQAQFLIPMAAALGFGIIVATAVLMLIVPALAMVQFDAAARRAGRRAERLEGQPSAA
jgi:multidrug efflux pump subunit AcrB